MEELRCAGEYPGLNSSKNFNTSGELLEMMWFGEDRRRCGEACKKSVANDVVDVNLRVSNPVPSLRGSMAGIDVICLTKDSRIRGCKGNLLIAPLWPCILEDLLRNVIKLECLIEYALQAHRGV